MNVIIFAITFDKFYFKLSANFFKGVFQVIYHGFCENAFAIFGDKDQMSVQGKNAVPAFSKITCIIHGPMLNLVYVIRKAYKYRLKVRSTVANIFSQAAGCCRLVWNKALALQKELLDNEESVLNYSKLCKQLSEWKKNEDFAFLRQVHSQPLQQSVKALDRALRECFGKKKGFPKFKKRGVQDSFSYPQGVRVEGNKVFLPKIGSIPFFQSSKLQGKIKNATVSKRGKFWFVSIQVEQEVKEPVHSSKSKVGIDMGVCRFATLSDGSVIYPLNSFKKLEKELAKEQKALSRKLKFSNNWKKQRQKVSQVHIRIADDRRDFLHKCSTKISEN